MGEVILIKKMLGKPYLAEAPKPADRISPAANRPTVDTVPEEPK